MVPRQRVWARLALVAVIVSVVSLGTVDVQARQKPSAARRLVPTVATITRTSQIGSSGAASLAPIPSLARDVSQPTTAIDSLIASSGGVAGVTLIELGGIDPISWSVNSTEVFTADPNGVVCFEAADYESGWFDDYEVGTCFTRNELAVRAGVYSDNTAGHMLVRDVGGAEVLNAWAASIGATSSQFFDGNTTTAADLAALWDAEAQGSLGGAAAQAWLYPMLTGTRTESGVPAGVGGATVVHKTGSLDLVENDAALVTSGPDGAYVLTVMTDGLGGAAGWQLISGISATVWRFEAARSD
jgi:beta-lactamase class A